MKVSIQHDMPHDEFVQKFGSIAGATYDAAHAALLRAQGIKPVSVETSYGATSNQVAISPPPAEPVQIIAPSADPTDLGPLYGIFVELADALTATRERLEGQIVDQEHVNQTIVQAVDNLSQRLSIIESAMASLAEAAERKLNAA